MLKFFNVKREPWQDAQAKPLLVLENLSKSYGATLSVNNLNLTIYPGELFSLLGESGCGKSTLLRMLAGLEMPTAGRILLDGIDITNWPAYRRPVNMMFQSYALFPHMSVWDNIIFGLKHENIAPREMQDRATEALDLVQLSHLANRYPHQLSGGQQQRIALARSLVKRPKLLLLDEPMGALDKRLREQTQFELVNIQERVGITFIMVTHDQAEAMTMSSRLGIMDSGRIRQIGTPHDIYEFPQSRFVAEFIGNINMFAGVVVEDENDHILIEAQELDGPLYITRTAACPVGSLVNVAIRPEKVILTHTPPNSQKNTARGVVKEIAYLGDMSVYYIQLTNGKVVQAALPNLLRLTERDIKWEDEVSIFWRPENGIVLTN